MLAADSRICFLCCSFFFFNIYYKGACQYFAIQLSIFWNSIIIFKEKKVSFFTIIKCYSNWHVQNADSDCTQVVLDCRSSTG